MTQQYSRFLGVFGEVEATMSYKFVVSALELVTFGVREF